MTKKKTTKRRKPNGDIAPLSGGIVHHTSAPCKTGSGSNGTSMKSRMRKKKEKDDLTAEEVEQYFREEFSDCFLEKLGKEDSMICELEELIIRQ